MSSLGKVLKALIVATFENMRKEFANLLLKSSKRRVLYICAKKGGNSACTYLFVRITHRHQKDGNSC